MLSAGSPALADAQVQGNGWIDLLDGGLANWVAKFKGYPPGENYLQTFRVANGVLAVSYDNWTEFSGEFGHLFYNTTFSHYRLRLEYRFTGNQVPGGPGWAFRNNGVMLHAQSPGSMATDQEFPVSIEVQLLGGSGVDARTTANVCTPGTHFVRNDALITPHCVNSSSGTHHGDDWVRLEVEVHGNRLIRHLVEGAEVLSYTSPQLDPSDPDAQRLMDVGHPIVLDKGLIAIQAESHPTEFRNIWLQPLARD